MRSIRTWYARMLKKTEKFVDFLIRKTFIYVQKGCEKITKRKNSFFFVEGLPFFYFFVIIYKVG